MSDPEIEPRLFAAATNGDVAALTALLDEHPGGLHARNQPYEWTLLHLAAQNGHPSAVDLLLRRGLDPNSREKGDNTYAIHWAAAAGHLDVVRRLADAGGDVIGHGDDHALEVIGWATCWDGCNDNAHRAVAEFLVDRGAQHHIFSAVAMDLGDEVRRLVAADPRALHAPMSHNEAHQLPLHFAVRMNRAAMVALLLELGADPLATDATGARATVYAASPDVDAETIEMLALGGAVDLFTALALGDITTAARLVEEDAGIIGSGDRNTGALHLSAKRGDVRAVTWLLGRDADTNVRWSHRGAEVTPLHFAALLGHADIVRALLDRGADPRIHDSMHDSDAMGWAEPAGRAEIVELLKGHGVQ